MAHNDVGIYASQISGHLWAPNGAMDALATVTVPSGGAASVTFAGIPQGYKHLQIRGIARCTSTASQAVAAMRFNSDSGANYTRHELAGNGSTASAYGAGSNTWAGYFTTPSSTTTLYNNNIVGVGVADILDYSNTNKYKTMRLFGGQDTNNTYGYLGLYSGVWMNTAAITDIQIFSVDGTSLAQYSSFALYGIE